MSSSSSPATFFEPADDRRWRDTEGSPEPTQARTLLVSAKDRLPFLIDREEDLFRKLEDVYYRDYKGTFTVSYKQDRKGRLLNFREGADESYRFEFPESGEVLVTNDLSDIDDSLLAIFMRRVEELG